MFGLRVTYAAVQGIPDRVGSGVEGTVVAMMVSGCGRMILGGLHAHLEGKGTGEDGGQENGVPADNAPKHIKCVLVERSIRTAPLTFCQGVEGSSRGGDMLVDGGSDLDGGRAAVSH